MLPSVRFGLCPMFNNIETWKIINFPYYQPSNPCRENEFDIEELILEEILNNPIEPFFVEIKDFSEKLEKFLKNLNGNDFFEGSEEESQYEYLEGNLEKYKNWRYWAICIQLLLLHEESPNFLRYKPFKLDENKPS